MRSILHLFCWLRKKIFPLRVFPSASACTLGGATPPPPTPISLFLSAHFFNTHNVYVVRHIKGKVRYTLLYLLHVLLHYAECDGMCTFFLLFRADRILRCLDQPGTQPPGYRKFRDPAVAVCVILRGTLLDMQYSRSSLSVVCSISPEMGRGLLAIFLKVAYKNIK